MARIPRPSMTKATAATTRQYRPIALAVAVVAVLGSTAWLAPAGANGPQPSSSRQQQKDHFANQGRPSTSSQAVTAQVAGFAGLIPLTGFLSTGSEWSRDITLAPLAMNSAGMVANLVKQVTTRYNGVAAFNWNSYNVSFAVATANTPRTTVIWDNCQNKPIVPSQLYDPRYGAHFVDVPIPSTAVPAVGTDGELTVWSPSTDQLWEFWKAVKKPDGWHACWGGRIDGFSKNPGYFTGRMGVSASGLALAPGVIGIQEMQVGQITHALRIGLPQVAHHSTFSYPAQRSDGNMPKGSTNAIMEGQRFRLDPSLDVSSLGLTPIAEAVARAAQVYGFIVTDRAGTLTVSTESGQAARNATGTNPWVQLMSGVPAYRIMKNFPWNRLEALPVDWGKPKS